MEYSKDIVIGVRYVNINSKGQAEKKERFKLIRKHKLISTIIFLCGMLIILDGVLIYNFIQILQNYEPIEMLF